MRMEAVITSITVTAELMNSSKGKLHMIVIKADYFFVKENLHIEFKKIIIVESILHFSLFRAKSVENRKLIKLLVI